MVGEIEPFQTEDDGGGAEPDRTLDQGGDVGRRAAPERRLADHVFVDDGAVVVRAVAVVVDAGGGPDGIPRPGEEIIPPRCSRR